MVYFQITKILISHTIKVRKHLCWCVCLFIHLRQHIYFCCKCLIKNEWWTHFSTLKPSILHITVVSSRVKLSSQMAPHAPSWKISTRPELFDVPLTSLISVKYWVRRYKSFICTLINSTKNWFNKLYGKYFSMIKEYETITTYLPDDYITILNNRLTYKLLSFYKLNCLKVYIVIFCFTCWCKSEGVESNVEASSGHGFISCERSVYAVSTVTLFTSVCPSLNRNVITKVL